LTDSVSSIGRPAGFSPSWVIPLRFGAVDVDQLTSKLVYFSYATLTTVGFGDVTPLHPFARSLAIAEAMVGQFFPAILIGALVAMTMQARPKA
jgi:hypothetical protein